MKAPAYARDLIAKRNRNDRIGDCFVAVGWPTPWLREFVECSPLARNAAMLATPEVTAYDWRLIVGLSVCVWLECDEQQARADEIALQIVQARPLRCFTLHAWRGDTRFHTLAGDFREAA